MNQHVSEENEDERLPREDILQFRQMPMENPESLLEAGAIANAMTDSERREPDPETQPIRVGSPFAIDPLEAIATRPIEPFYDVGPIRYTAMGAVAASVMVLGFASVAAWWFPAGGALIAALGCALSVFGMYSTFRLAAVGLLTIHLCLFVLSYGRSLG